MIGPSRPLAVASVPDSIVDHDRFVVRLAEVIAGVLGEAETTPDMLQLDKAVDGRFRLSVGGRPAILGLELAGDEDEQLDEIALRLLHSLDLWEFDLWEEWSGRERAVRQYLARLGIRARTPIDSDDSAVVVAERAMDAGPTEIVLEVPAEVARRASPDDIGAVVQLRREIFHRSGIELPDVRVQLTEPRLRRLRIGLNSTFLTVRTVPPDAGWGYVVRCLARALEGRLHWFLRREQVQLTLDNLWYVVPDLVDACRRCYPDDLLTACLRELVHHGQNLRNLTRIMWLLLDLAGDEAVPDAFLMAETPLLQAGRLAITSTDPVMLASRVRKRLREEAWRVGVPTRPVRSGRLSEEVEGGLLRATGRDELAGWEWAAVKQFEALQRPDVLVVRSIAAIPSTWDALRCLADHPEVVASGELPPDADLSAIPVAD